MRTVVPSALRTEMSSGQFSPVSNVYVEPNLPTWSQVSQAGTPPQNPLGHDAIYSGTSLLRARSGSLASPTSGILYFARIVAPDINDPTTWESKWVSTGITNCARPAYSASTNPGQVALASDGAGKVQIFYFDTSNQLSVIESTDWGSSWGTATVLATVDNAALQVAACQVDECFFTDYIVVFTQWGSTPPSVSATVIKRATKSGTWSVDTDWPMRGRWYFMRTARDPADITNPLGDTTTWGDPVWAGLGAVERPDGRVQIVTGGILLDALSRDGSQQGIFTFIYDRDADLWWPGATISIADYDDNSWLFDFFARASIVNNQVWFTWQYEDEPTDERQDTTSTPVPRKFEIVYSRSLEGDYFTEMQAISADAQNVGAGPVVLIGTKLYMVSWYHICQADATWIVGGTTRTDISNMAGPWSIRQTGRGPNMTADVTILDPGGVTISTGDLITIEAGTATNGTVVVGKGYVDTYDTALSVDERRLEGSLEALTAKPLTDTRSRENIDILPQAVTHVVPTDMGQLAIDSGRWQVEDSPDWAGSSGAGLTQTKFIEISSFADNKWHQTAKITHPQTLNGSIQAKVRMGLLSASLWGASGTTNYTYTPDFDYWDGLYYTYVNGFGTRWGYTPWSVEADLDYAAVGLMARAYSNTGNRSYVFAWEPALYSWDQAARRTHPDTNLGEFDDSNLVQDGIPSQDNALVLYLFDEYNDSVYRGVVASNTSHGLVPGNIAELRMVVHYDQIHCYYRAYGTADWSLAFSYTEAGLLGAGRFGVYGRGFNGPEPGCPSDQRNRAWLWDIQVAGEEPNITVEDVVENLTWRAGIEIDTDDLITGVPGSNPGLYTTAARDPVVRAEVSLSAKAGFIMRATDVNNGIYLGITPGAIGTGKMTLEEYSGGSPTTTIPVPTWFTIPTGVTLPVLASLHDNWYSIWIGGLLLGSIYYEYEGSTGFGLFGSATWTSVRVPELYEVPTFATIDSGQTMLDALSGFLGKRRIKRFMRYNGKMRLGSYLTHPVGPTIVDTMVRNSKRTVDRIINHCRVQGAFGWAEYKSPSLILSGRRFMEAHLPDIESRVKMYEEAKAIVRDSVELSQQNNFEGAPDLAIEPEDQVSITVTLQSVNDNYLVDDVALAWDGGELIQSVGTRKVYTE